jgi:hypothetical protein
MGEKFIDFRATNEKCTQIHFEWQDAVTSFTTVIYTCLKLALILSIDRKISLV